MLKFYFNGAPNPNKVALFLEETGLPYELMPVDTRKGDQFKPEFLKVNPNGKVPAIDDDGVFVFDSQRDPALPRREDRQVHAAEHAEEPRAIAVMADVHRHRRRPLFGPGRAFQAFRAEGPGIRPQPLPVRGAAPLRILNDHLAKSRYMVGDTYTIVDMAFWGWARMAPFVLGDDVYAKYPNVKRLVDEVAARPAAARAIALKDKFTFKAEMDDEAKHIMFGHLKTKAA